MWGANSVWMAAILLPLSDATARPVSTTTRPGALSSLPIRRTASMFWSWPDKCREDAYRLLGDLRAPF